MFMEAAYRTLTDSRPLTAKSLIAELVQNRSSSGVPVTNESVLGNPFVYRSIAMLSQDVSKLPRDVFRREGEGSREALRSHPVNRAFSISVNEATKSNAFLRTMMGHALLHRGGYAEILRSPSGQVELEILDPRVTHPLQVFGEVSGMFYQTQNARGQDRLIAHANVFHVRGLGFDTFDSYSVLDKLKEALGLGLAQQKYAAVYFRNNAQPKLVIKFPGQLQDDQAVERFRNSWGTVHGGVDNSHKPAILEGGAEVESISPNAEETQLKELRELDARIVAAIFGIPPHKVGDPTRTSFASLEQENQSYLDQAIDPWLTEIESEVNFKLLNAEFPDVFFEFNREALVRMNFKDKMAGLQIGVLTGFISRQDARRKLNMNDEPGLEEFLVPMNMSINGEEPEPEPGGEPEPPVNQEPEEEEDDRLEKLIQLTIRRMVDRVVKRVRFSSEIDMMKHFDVWVENFEPICGENRAVELATNVLTELQTELRTCNGKEAATQILKAYECDLPNRLYLGVKESSNGTSLCTN